MRHIWIWI